MIKLTNVMNHPIGNFLISAILGLGLAAIFKKVCNEGHCVVIKGPPYENIKDKIFVFEDKCYKYKPKAVSCKNPDN
jgi:hypothetical protein